MHILVLSIFVLQFSNPPLSLSFPVYIIGVCIGFSEEERVNNFKIAEKMAATIVGSKQAEQLKQDGNNYFQKNRFGAAIDAYTEVLFYFYFIFLWLVLGQMGYGF